MDTLKAVDGVEALILIDNATDNLSSVPSFVDVATVCGSAGANAYAALPSASLV